MSKQYPLNVPAPHHFTYAVRDLPEVTVEQRERALQATHYNEFAFPSGMLTVDMLSDSGTTAMTNHQWATLFLGDEAYGRNTGYYVLLDTFRDIFERGGEKNWKKIIDLVRTDCRDVEKMMDEVYLCEYEGGLFNGGAAQMERPNAFIIQQGRAAESVLMEIVQQHPRSARHPGQGVHHPLQRPLRHHRGQHQADGFHPAQPVQQGRCCMRVPEGGTLREEPVQGQHGHREAGAADPGRRSRERSADLHLHHQQPDLRPGRFHGATCGRSTALRISTTSRWYSMPLAGLRTLTSSR